MYQKYFLLLAVSLFVVVGCKKQRPEELNLKILATTDVHGAIFPYDLVEDAPAQSSLAQIYSYVAEQRKKPDQEVLLLDNGDILQGQPLVYYSNFEQPDESHICSQVMNFMGYDAGTVGNHDLEPGHAVYDKIRNEFQFPWLAANAVRNEDGKPYFQPYTVVKRQGVRIAVLGLITPAIPQWLPEKIWEGMHFDPMVSSAEKWVNVIREKEKPDVLIGLFHSGVGTDEAGNGEVMEQASRLVAEKVAGFDLIICGHDHQKNLLWVENPKGEQVPVINPKNSAQYLAEIDLHLSYNPQEKRYEKQIHPRLIEVKELPLASDFSERFDSLFRQVRNYVDRPVGHFIQTISTRDAFVGDAAFVDLIQQVQLDLSGAEISFAAPLSFNAEIKAGELHVRDLFKLYRYENLLYTMKLSGQEVKDYLEYSCDLWFNQMNDEGDHMLKLNQKGRRYWLQNPFFNFDAAEGIRYTVDVSRPYGERVHITGMQNGEPFDLRRNYLVAVNSYRGNGGGGHLTKGAGIPKEELASRIVKTTTKDLRYYLLKWIEEKGEINPQCDSNWTVVPNQWYQVARKRDYQLLFGE